MDTVHPFAELDALRTERNSSVAESKLWLRRLGSMQRERDQARQDLHAADKCLGEWIEAYETLHHDYLRLQIRRDHELWLREYYESLLKYLDPYLPRWLQTERHADNELLYVQLAQYRADDAGPK